MKVKISIICLLFVAVFFSCKKDDSLPDPVIPVITGTKPTLLLSKVLIDNQPSFEYLYNGAKLISEEKSKYSFTINHFNDKNQVISSDYYSNMALLSSDLMVYQTAMNQVEWVTPDMPNKGGSIQYEYNPDGQLSKATYSPIAGAVQFSEFKYDANGRISKQILFWDQSQTGYIDYLYDTRGNLTKETLYDLLPTGDSELNTTTQYEYDNQKNPFMQAGSVVIPGINTNMNNIIKETFSIHMPADKGTDTVEVTDTSYEYNDKGYPVSKNGNVDYIYL